ncbi:hypothetical protein AUJ22_01805 [Candidatus Nomurabacteria bacterium CG1_02_31_12]|uniref:D-alanine--D-alanine ligase C-terminal domain-containing protein n=1 Tax=Candidatus Nomurabacteria bacterium CG1_02_31_12 TaxID=1805280 RepID=A0A1J4V3R2_9BACT|nr:MAG: hypothetical protein AUJ22_01805 [Candidatus Nomurabacteria bacterium CG1_02_31_12]
MLEKKEKNKIRVGVIRGGADKYYQNSLLKGRDIISHIFENLSHKYNVVDILIDKNGIWHAGGIPINPADLMSRIDVAWNTSKHLDSSNILDNLSIPSIENGFFSSVVENNNDILRTHIKGIGIKMPRSIVLPSYQKDFDKPIEKYVIEKAKEVLNKFSAPWIVKSFTPDSSMGIHLAKTFGELVDAIKDGVDHDKSILIEEFILGKVSSLHSISGFRGEDIYVFPPQNFTNSEKEKIISLAKDLHTHLGAKHYLKSDFVLHPKLGFFLINVDFSPDLRALSHFEQSCKYVGAEIHHILEHLIDRALNK